jgi:hypothetical protein
LFQRSEETIATSMSFDAAVDFELDIHAGICGDRLVIDRHQAPPDPGQFGTAAGPTDLSHLPTLQQYEGNTGEEQKKKSESHNGLHILDLRKQLVVMSVLRSWESW